MIGVSDARPDLVAEVNSQYRVFREHLIRLTRQMAAPTVARRIRRGRNQPRTDRIPSRLTGIHVGVQPRLHPPSAGSVRCDPARGPLGTAPNRTRGLEGPTALPYVMPIEASWNEFLPVAKSIRESATQRVYE